MSVLYLVGTPIGNLEDISLRALRVLGEVGLIAAEDTRTTGRLLKHYQIETALTSYHEYSGPGRIEGLLQRLETADVALVSDAGMPGLSDPGYRLVQAAVAAGVQVVPIPGPAAAVVALVSSGLPSDRFLFLGFLPRQKGARRAALVDVATLPYSLVLYEAPHRILALLGDIEKVLGDRQVSIGRELTKLHEEIWRGPASEAREYFSQGKIRGEFTVVVAGAEASAGRWSEVEVRQAMHDQLQQGRSRKDASAAIAKQASWRPREVYNLSLED